MKIMYKGREFSEQEMDDALYLLQKEKERIDKENREQIEAVAATIESTIFKERD